MTKIIIIDTFNVRAIDIYDCRKYILDLILVLHYREELTLKIFSKILSGIAYWFVLLSLPSLAEHLFEPSRPFLAYIYSVLSVLMAPIIFSSIFNNLQENKKLLNTKKYAYLGLFTASIFIIYIIFSTNITAKSLNISLFTCLFVLMAHIGMIYDKEDKCT